jgi:dihydrofolate reductase
MRKLKIMEHISLDGVIQISDGRGDSDFAYGDWTAPYRTPEGFAMVTKMFGETFDLLLGRRTYDVWSGYWPKAPKSPLADRLNSATKYVATHRPESLVWGPFEGVGPDLVDSVRRMKAKDGADLILWGSSALTSAVLEHGLAEEMVLLVYRAGQRKAPFCGRNSATHICTGKHASFAVGRRHQYLQRRWTFAEPEIRSVSVMV